jgi:Tfp pilus assembly protein PilF
MAGMILQAQGKNDNAKKRYERAIRLDPRAAVAANNLAWLYAEQGQNLDAALQLAQSAKAELPELSEINDTLGFVYLQKKLPDLAVGPLREAVQKEPANPIYRYRLGMAYAQSGQNDQARQELTRALSIKADFPGADDARRILKSLG